MDSKVVQAFARMAYAIVLADGEIDEAERHLLDNILKDSPIIPFVNEMIQKEEEVMIVEAFHNLSEVCDHVEEKGKYMELMESLEVLKNTGGVLDEDDAEILRFIIENLKKKFQ